MSCVIFHYIGKLELCRREGETECLKVLIWYILLCGGVEFCPFDIFFKSEFSPTWMVLDANWDWSRRWSYPHFGLNSAHTPRLNSITRLPLIYQLRCKLGCAPCLLYLQTEFFLEGKRRRGGGGRMRCKFMIRRIMRMRFCYDASLRLYVFLLYVLYLMSLCSFSSCRGIFFSNGRIKDEDIMNHNQTY